MNIAHSNELNEHCTFEFIQTITHNNSKNIKLINIIVSEIIDGEY